jgi:SAM-dependent methyltransferase
MSEISGPSKEDLETVFKIKYGEPDQRGWCPAMYSRFGYYSPDNYYESLVFKLVFPNCSWLDVGCGRDLFPSNRNLAKILSERCGLLVGVDPHPNIYENPFLHERFQGVIEDFQTHHTFDLITMRMVAEHVEQPARLLDSLVHCTRPGALVVIYTVNKNSTVPIITHLMPFAVHQPIKRLLWHTEEQDTFPTVFRMNTRVALQDWMGKGQFEEAFFAYLDDCRSFSRFRSLLFAELTLWKLLQAVSVRYPETCLLGVYRRR